MILCVLCWRWLGLLFSVLNVFVLPLCARRQTLQQGTGCTVCDLWPCPLPRMGWSLSVSCGSFDSSPCSEHSALRLATGLSRCFSANLWHQVLNWNFFLAHETVAENPGRQHRPARTVWPAGGRSSSQPTCLYYTVLTKSLCLTTPFLYSNGETLSVYVFDNCTNAPLWKRNETLTYLE